MAALFEWDAGKLDFAREEARGVFARVGIEVADE
jgi:hypothetical protein